MPAFPKPKFPYLRPGHGAPALRAHAGSRGVPRRRADRLLLATWNIANLGLQERRDKDYRVLAEVCGWFDVVAVQEVNDDLDGLRALHGQAAGPLPRALLGGGGEPGARRLLYDARKVRPLEKVGRLSIPPSQLERIKLPGTTQRFQGFDRGPYLAAFGARSFRFLLVNVHLYYGSEAAEDIKRRSLETFAVAYWADRRRRSKHAFTRDIIPLGDFDLPRLEPTDPIFRALTSRGLALRKAELREHLSVVGGSSLGGRNPLRPGGLLSGRDPGAAGDRRVRLRQRRLPGPLAGARAHRQAVPGLHPLLRLGPSP